MHVTGTGWLMEDTLLETLPIAHRLALSYAPVSAKADTLALLALDARLAGIVRGDGEAIIAQMKLAWWRDRFAADRSQWPLGEPLLALFKKWRGDPSRLIALVDGWEVLLSETLDSDAIYTFCQGKSLAWAAMADGLSTGGAISRAEQAAKENALLELARNLSDNQEAELATDLCAKESWQRASLPRELRTLEVLHALSRRAWKTDRPAILDGPGAMALAMRVGITGR